MTISRDAPKWQKVIDSVKVESLPITYADGKQIAESRDIVTRDLGQLQQFSDEALRTGRLVADISLLSAIQEFQSQMQQFASLLLSDSATNDQLAKKVSAWSDAMADIANGPVETLYKASFPYLIGRAVDLERSCPAAIAK